MVTPPLLRNFLVECLDDQRYGRHLEWVDRDKLLFQIDWTHQSKKDWSEDKAQVFKVTDNKLQKRT